MLFLSPVYSRSITGKQETFDFLLIIRFSLKSIKMDFGNIFEWKLMFFCFPIFPRFSPTVWKNKKAKMENLRKSFKYTNNYCELSLDLFLSKMKCFPVFSFVFPFFHHFKTGKHSVFKKSSEFHWKVSKWTLESFLNENHCFTVFHDLTLLCLKTRKQNLKTY